MSITNGFKPLRKPTDIEVRRLTLSNAVGTSALTIGVGSALQVGTTGGGTASVYAHSAFATGAGTSNPVLGIVISLIFKGKITEYSSIVGVNSAGGTGTTPATWAPTSTVNQTANVYNDNEYSGNWQVEYIPTYIPIQYTATLNAVAETTANSSGAGWFRIYASTAGHGTLDESTILPFTDTTIANHQFFSYGTTVPGGTTVNGHFGLVV